MEDLGKRIFAKDDLLDVFDRALRPKLAGLNGASISDKLALITEVFSGEDFFSSLSYDEKLPYHLKHNAGFLKRRGVQMALQLAWDAQGSVEPHNSVVEWDMEARKVYDGLNLARRIGQMDDSEIRVLDWCHRLMSSRNLAQRLLEQEKYEELEELASIWNKSTKDPALESVEPFYTSSNFSKNNTNWNLTNWAVSVRGVSKNDDPLKWVKQGRVRNEPLLEGLNLLFKDAAFEWDGVCRGLGDNLGKESANFSDRIGAGGVIRKFLAPSVGLKPEYVDKSFHTLSSDIPLRVKALYKAFHSWRDSLQELGVEYKSMNTTGLTVSYADPKFLDVDYNAVFSQEYPWKDREYKVDFLSPYIRGRMEELSKVVSFVEEADSEDKDAVKLISAIVDDLYKTGMIPRYAPPKEGELSPFWSDLLAKEDPFSSYSPSEVEFSKTVVSQAWWRAIYKHSAMVGLSKTKAMDIWEKLNEFAESDLIGEDNQISSEKMSLEAAVICAALDVGVSPGRSYALGFRCAIGSSIPKDRNIPVDLSEGNTKYCKNIYSGKIGVSGQMLVCGAAKSFVSVRSAWSRKLKSMDSLSRTDRDFKNLLEKPVDEILGRDGKSISLGTAFGKPEFWDEILPESFKEGLLEVVNSPKNVKYVIPLDRKVEDLLWTDEHGSPLYINPNMEKWLSNVSYAVQVQARAGRDLFDPSSYESRDKNEHVKFLFGYGVRELSLDLDARLKQQGVFPESLESELQMAKDSTRSLSEIQAVGFEVEDIDSSILSEIQSYGELVPELALSRDLDSFSSRRKVFAGSEGYRFMKWCRKSRDSNCLDVFSSVLNGKDASETFEEFKGVFDLTGRDFVRNDRAKWILNFMVKLDYSNLGDRGLYTAVHWAKGVFSAYNSSSYRDHIGGGVSTLDSSELVEAAAAVKDSLNPSNVGLVVEGLRPRIETALINGCTHNVLRQLNREISAPELTTDSANFIRNVSQILTLHNSLNSVTEALSQEPSVKMDDQSIEDSMGREIPSEISMGLG